MTPDRPDAERTQNEAIEQEYLAFCEEVRRTAHHIAAHCLGGRTKEAGLLAEASASDRYDLAALPDPRYSLREVEERENED
jgi:hypothetical protein